MSIDTIYTIYTDEAGSWPILNGSKVKDDEGVEYTFISGNQREGTVTVKDASGKFRTTSAPTFNCHFKKEEADV